MGKPYVIYKVREGDDLFSVANGLHVSLEDVAYAAQTVVPNNGTGSVKQIGATLSLPQLYGRFVGRFRRIAGPPADVKYTVSITPSDFQLLDSRGDYYLDYYLLDAETHKVGTRQLDYPIVDVRGFGTDRVSNSKINFNDPRFWGAIVDQSISIIPRGGTEPYWEVFPEKPFFVQGDGGWKYTDAWTFRIIDTAPAFPKVFPAPPSGAWIIATIGEYDSPESLAATFDVSVADLTLANSNKNLALTPYMNWDDPAKYTGAKIDIHDPSIWYPGANILIYHKVGYKPLDSWNPVSDPDFPGLIRVQSPWVHIETPTVPDQPITKLQPIDDTTQTVIQASGSPVSTIPTQSASIVVPTKSPILWLAAGILAFLMFGRDKKA